MGKKRETAKNLSTRKTTKTNKHKKPTTKQQFEYSILNTQDSLTPGLPSQEGIQGFSSTCLAFQVAFPKMPAQARILHVTRKAGWTDRAEAVGAPMALMALLSPSPGGLDQIQ